MKKKLIKFTSFLGILLLAELGSYVYLIFAESAEEKKIFHWQAYENYVNLGRDISPWSTLRPHPFYGSVSTVHSHDLDEQLWLSGSSSFKLGVIGGSAASKVASILKQNPDHPFIKKIRQVQKLQDSKVIEVYSFSLNSIRQPQQLQVLNLNLGKLDYILQIDELDLSTLPDKRYPSYFPQMSHVLYPYDHSFWYSFVKSFHLGSLSLKMAELAGDWPFLGKSNLYYFAWTFTKPKLQNKNLKFTKLNYEKNAEEFLTYRNSLVYFISQELQLLSWAKKPFYWTIIVQADPLSHLNFLERKFSKQINFKKDQSQLEIMGISFF